jgi:hypothetical protein
MHINIGGEPEGKISLGRPRHKWVDNVKLDLRKIGWGSINRIDLDQDRDRWRDLANTAMNLWVPENVG